jgi:hypothetical protein
MHQIVKFSVDNFVIAFSYPKIKNHILIKDTIVSLISNSKNVDVYVNIHYDKFPNTLNEDKNCKIIKCYSKKFQGNYKIIKLNYDKKKVDIYFNSLVPISIRSYIIDEGTLELIFRYFLKSVVYIHSCSTILKDKGIIFAGGNGAGKSTLANILHENNERVLTDEMTFIRDRGKFFTIFPSLSRGRYFTIFPDSKSKYNFFPKKMIKLDRIFLLQHGKKNKIFKLNKYESIMNLFPLFTFSDNNMLNSLEFLIKLVDKIPVHTFEFTPDKKVIKFLYEILN